MIGAGFINKNKTWEFKSFIMEYKTKESERKMLDSFWDFINKKLKEYKKTESIFIHWSQAEPIIFNKKLKEFGIIEDKYNLPWYDLLRVFKYSDEPIIIKNCFSFGLKDIVKNLNSRGMIDLSWPELDDGLLSSFIAKDIYQNKNISITNMISIVEYNYIDCLALDKLLVWMRNYINKN
jgi:hypothetical protein